MFATRRRALVDGHGAVGAALQTQMHFDVVVGRRDVVGLLDEPFDVVVCATTAPFGAWSATGELQHLSAIARTVARVRARHVVVLSTTDVFDRRSAADEDSPAGTGDVDEHDRMSAWFEHAVREYHPSQLTLRLPTCIGAPLESSLLADLVVSGGDVALDLTVSHQLYDLGRLASDLQLALDAGITSANLVSEPVTARDVVETVGSRAAASYLAAVDRSSRLPVTTRYASLFGTADEYVTDRATALASVGRWWHAQAGVPVGRVS